MTRYTYLLIDCLSLALPLAFSFHPRIRLYKHWNALLPAIFVVAVCYALWDSWFTRLAIWGFSSRYITGIYIGNLPLEEILFFLCIPYACVFTFECLSGFISSDLIRKNIRIISYGIVIILIALALYFHSEAYTFSAFALPALMIIGGILRNISWFAKFYVVYAILLIPFFIVNGLLTGAGLSGPVVWYNPMEIIGLRIITIPVEDFFYGMGLIWANVWLYITIKNKISQQSSILS